MQNNKCVIKEAKDSSEAIICKTCGNKIYQLTSLRCPRCFSPLLKAGGCNGDCNKCG